jgi:hypothetical protein
MTLLIVLREDKRGMWTSGAGMLQATVVELACGASRVVFTCNMKRC